MDVGTPVARIVETLTKHFGPQCSDIELGVTEFLTGLEQAGLIVPAIARQEEDSAGGWLRSRNLPTAFQKPTFEKYTDMQQLLLLDPIHDVDDTGWPHVAAERSNQGEDEN